MHLIHKSMDRADLRDAPKSRQVTQLLVNVVSGLHDVPLAPPSQCRACAMLRLSEGDGNLTIDSRIGHKQCSLVSMINGKTRVNIEGACEERREGFRSASAVTAA